MKTVLIATDLSESSDEAILQGHDLAAASGATLVAVTVLPRIAGTGVDPLFPPAALRTTLATPDLEARAAKVAEERLAELTARARLDVRVRLGDAALEIVACAEEVGADLVVVGSHGRTGLARMMLGSTAERVARTAKCNVLVARRRVADTGAGAVVAVATDLTDKSDAAFDFAAREAKRRSARLVAIHAVADANVLAYAELAAAFGATSIGPPPELDDEVHAAMSKLLAAKLAGSNVIGEVVLPHGEAARAVVGVVESMGSEIVVVGRGRKSTLERIALGSVAEKIVRHAHCSVFVAREPEAG